MLSRVYTVGVRGVDGYSVLVELDLANGLPQFTTVGLPDSSVRESRDRVASAVRNSGFKFPPRRVTVNLAPAVSRKQGTQFDLPIALAFLSASGQIKPVGGKYCFVGELALDGSLRGIPGTLSMAMKANEMGFEAIVVPAENADEAAAAGIKALSAGSLKEVVAFLNGEALSSVSVSRPKAAPPKDDLSDVKGQPRARRALEIAAAGGHNILFVGPPGAGKSMLAKRLPALLPPMSRGERLECTRIHSAMGLKGLIPSRPFRSPHHTSSATSLIGGGPSCRPGEAALAHGGVLFLDEAAEFTRQALDSLRQPMEDHRVVVTRAKDVLEYPARFILVAASNPCPCGWHGFEEMKECRCTPRVRDNYLNKLSGPLLDRIDIRLHVPPMKFEAWSVEKPSEPSSDVRKRVEAARCLQSKRLKRADFAVNAYMGAADLRKHCALDPAGTDALSAASESMSLTARGLDRVLRVARTIADLAGSDAIQRHHLTEAIQFRREI